MLRQKVKKLKRRIEELEDLLLLLDQLVESPAIAKLINDEVVQLLQAMSDLDSNDDHIKFSLANAVKRGNELCKNSLNRQLNRLQESDAQIARAQHCLNETGRILRLQQARAHITADELETFIRELSWAYLQINVITHVGQGHKALNKKDFGAAMQHYRKAQHALIQSNHADPRLQRMIREVSELLSQKRTSLSLDLMPEAQYNPAPKEQKQSEPSTEPADSNQEAENTQEGTQDSA